MSTTRFEAFWAAFVQSIPPEDPRRFAEPDSFGFGSDAGIADELAGLVLAGRKRATASLPIEYTATGEPLPKTGDLSIILNGGGDPVALIERTVVETMPFGEVTEDFAACEGEGDGSLQYWRQAHTWYFNRVLSQYGQQVDNQTEVICQQFILIWPAASLASSE